MGGTEMRDARFISRPWGSTTNPEDLDWVVATAVAAAGVAGKLSDFHDEDRWDSGTPDNNDVAGENGD